jgi:hypothetical protein
MSKVQIQPMFLPISEVSLALFEQELDLTLPTDYRDFLLEHNGGKPNPCIFPVANNPYDNKSMLHYFFGVTDGELGNLAKWIKLQEDKLPEDLIPIGIDLGGNLLCLSVRGDFYGKIYFWDADIPEDDEEIPPTEIFFVADSFTALLESFCPPNWTE